MSVIFSSFVFFVPNYKMEVGVAVSFYVRKYVRYQLRKASTQRRRAHRAIFFLNWFCEKFYNLPIFITKKEKN